jgi:hypothetical protein
MDKKNQHLESAVPLLLQGRIFIPCDATTATASPCHGLQLPPQRGSKSPQTTPDCSGSRWKARGGRMRMIYKTGFEQFICLF